MKFTNTLPFLLLLATPSAFALRGAGQHRAQNDATSIGHARVLGSNNYNYKKRKGACRTNSDGTGAGSHRQEFYRHEWKNDHDVSYEWCKRKCNKEGKDCKGFEYYDHGEDSHCEIWTHEIGGYNAHRDDHYCYIKEYEGDDDKRESDDTSSDDTSSGGGRDDSDDTSSDEDEDEGDYDTDLYEHKEGACRKSSHPRNGKKGEDYSRHGGKSFEWCEKKCSDDRDCTGFEYFYKHGKKHCEIWSTHIDDYERSDFFDCYVKKD